MAICSYNAVLKQRSYVTEKGVCDSAILPKFKNILIPSVTLIQNKNVFNSLATNS